MTKKQLNKFLKHLHKTGALSVPPPDLRAVIEKFSKS